MPKNDLDGENEEKNLVVGCMFLAHDSLLFRLLSGDLHAFQVLRLRRVPIRECHRETVTEKSPPQTHVSNKPAASSRDPQSSSSFHPIRRSWQRLREFLRSILDNKITIRLTNILHFT